MKKIISVLLCVILLLGMMPVTSFAEGTDTIIDKVYVNGIDAPVVGAAPDMEANCGEGYTITKIVWVDSTGEYKDWVYDVEKFEAGHKYTVQITLVTKEGYKYLVVDGYNEVVGEINTEPAIEYGSHSDTEVAIGYDFGEIEAVVIDKVYVNDIDAPVVGAVPDMEATCGEGYTITKIVWVDSTGEYKDWVYDVEKFEAGHKYTVQITLVTKEGYKYLVVDGYNEVVGEINMESAIVYGSHSDTEVAIGYDFGEASVSSGDVNGDEIIDALDALLVLQHSVKLIQIEESAFVLGDVDGSGIIDAKDALLILQYSVKLIPSFPVEASKGE